MLLNNTEDRRHPSWKIGHKVISQFLKLKKAIPLQLKSKGTQLFGKTSSKKNLSTGVETVLEVMMKKFKKAGKVQILKELKKNYQSLK